MDKQEAARKNFPTDYKSYRIMEEIGRGTNSIVYRALCVSMNTNVAIKIINLDQCRYARSVVKESMTMKHSGLIHQNILNIHCTFFANDDFKLMWIVMPFMSAGSLLSIVSTSFPTGLSEDCIADILLQTLDLMSYLHLVGLLFLDIKPANMFLDLNNKAIIKFANICYPPLPPRGIAEEISESPYWVPPEVYKSSDRLFGYTVKSDTWSIGILALELAQGKPPVSNNIPLPTSLTKMMNNRLFSMNSGECSYSDKKRAFSESFTDLVKQCLEQCPAKRASLETLRNHRFFKRCKFPGFLLHNMLKDLPGETDRNRFSKAVGKKEEEKKEAEDGRSPSKIYGWELNVENLELFPSYSLEFNCDHDHHHHHHRHEIETVTQGEKRVRFGGETVIMEDELTMMEIDDEDEDEEEVVNDMWNGISEPIHDIINDLEEMSQELNEVNENTTKEDLLLRLVITKSNLEKQLSQITFLIDLHGDAMKEEANLQVKQDAIFREAMEALKPPKSS